MQVILRRFPPQRAHREKVIPNVMSNQLLLEVFQGIEAAFCIEVFVVLAVRSLYLAIVPRSIRTDLLMLYAIRLKLLLE